LAREFTTLRRKGLTTQELAKELTQLQTDVFPHGAELASPYAERLKPSTMAAMRTLRETGIPQELLVSKGISADALSEWETLDHQTLLPADTHTDTPDIFSGDEPDEGNGGFAEPGDAEPPTRPRAGPGGRPQQPGDDSERQRIRNLPIARLRHEHRHQGLWSGAVSKTNREALEEKLHTHYTEP
jgi:hypothetical protein